MDRLLGQSVWPSILAICCFNVVVVSHLYGYQTFI